MYHPSCKHVCHDIKRYLELSFYGAFPNYSNPITPPQASLIVRSIPDYIRANLLPPEFTIAGWPFKQMTFMSVPEAAIDKHDGFVFFEYQIRFSRESGASKSISKTLIEQGLSDQNFRASIFASNTRHHFAALFCRDDVQPYPTNLSCGLVSADDRIFLFSSICGFIIRAIVVITGTTTELPNCLYDCVSDTGILKSLLSGST